VRVSLIVLALLAAACTSPIAAQRTAPSGAIQRIELPRSTATARPRNPDGTINVLVEIPAGTNAKWETTKDGSTLVWEQLGDGTLRVVQYLPYPGNYGMLPGTLLPEATGGDGDPLDVLLLGPARERGELVRANLIGVLVLKDDGEIDDKLLAVSPDGPFAEVQDVTELDTRFPGTTSILATWFASYKGPGRVVVEGLRDRTAALALLEAATLPAD
jgi:inorganic pyrophosphatase